MCRSSRILGFLVLGLVAAFFAPTLADAGGVSVRVGASFGARPFMGAPRAALRPGVFPAVRPGVRPGVAGVARTPGRLGRFGRRGFGYGGFDVAGLGLSLGGDLGAPPAWPEDGYGPEPQPSFRPAVPPPCIRPLIISIGHGLRRPARTRIVYGAPPRCGY